MKAIITGDLVSSSKLSNTVRTRTVEAVEQEVSLWSTKLLFEKEEVFYRGDSLQILVKNPKYALEIALCMRLQAKIASNKKSDLRFAIGIGETEQLSERITKSDGEAFRYSGRTLEDMQEERMRIKTKNEQWNASMNTSLLLADTVMSNWSVEVCEAVYFSLKGKAQRELAEQFSISQPAVHKRLKIGGYHSISQLVNHYKQAVEWI